MGEGKRGKILYACHGICTAAAKHLLKCCCDLKETAYR